MKETLIIMTMLLVSMTLRPQECDTLGLELFNVVSNNTDTAVFLNDWLISGTAIQGTTLTPEKNGFMTKIGYVRGCLNPATYKAALYSDTGYGTPMRLLAVENDGEVETTSCNPTDLFEMDTTYIPLPEPIEVFAGVPYRPCIKLASSGPWRLLIDSVPNELSWSVGNGWHDPFPRSLSTIFTEPSSYIKAIITVMEDCSEPCDSVELEKVTTNNFNIISDNLADHTWYSGHDEISGSQVEVSTTSKVSQIGVVMGALSQRIECAIYSDTNGLPGDFISQAMWRTGEDIELPFLDTVYAQLPTPLYVSEGEKYWAILRCEDTNIFNVVVDPSGTGGRFSIDDDPWTPPYPFASEFPETFDEVQNDDIEDGAFAIFFVTEECVEMCTGDLDSDGLVNSSDLLIFLSGYGCTAACPIDFNNDTVTDTQDMLIFLGAFGEICP